MHFDLKRGADYKQAASLTNRAILRASRYMKGTKLNRRQSFNDSNVVLYRRKEETKTNLES